MRYEIIIRATETGTQVAVNVDVAGGTAVVTDEAYHRDPETRREGSVTDDWRGLDLGRLVSALPTNGGKVIEASAEVAAVSAKPEPVSAPVECPRCHRMLTKLTTPHNDKRLGGKRCLPKAKEPRRPWRKAPEDILSIFEQHGSSPKQTAEALRVPEHTIQSWIKRARDRAAAKDVIDSLPIAEQPRP